MRRRWPWIGGSVLLLLLIFSARMVLLLRAPFDFLAELEPLPVRDAKDLGIDPEKDSFYCMKAEFEPLTRKAGEELRSHGFTMDPHGGTHGVTFVGPNGQLAIFMKTGPLEEASWKTMMYAPSTDPGWVTILLKGVDQPTPLSRLNKWLGL